MQPYQHARKTKPGMAGRAPHVRLFSLSTCDISPPQVSDNFLHRILVKQKEITIVQRQSTCYHKHNYQITLPLQLRLINNILSIVMHQYDSFIRKCTILISLNGKLCHQSLQNTDNPVHIIHRNREVIKHAFISKHRMLQSKYPSLILLKKCNLYIQTTWQALHIILREKKLLKFGSFNKYDTH